MTSPVLKRLGLVAASFFAFGGAALAGECPADKVVPTGEGQTAEVTQPKDVTDTVLATVDLAHETIAAEGRLFRMRGLVIQPGGEMPWHDHADRPAIIYITAGEVTEYASTCAVPIVHRAGEVANESVGLQHWWRNEGSVPARLISADIFHAEADADDKAM
jgi:quercetin dioxygenase-like cupin family protein